MINLRSAREIDLMKEGAQMLTGFMEKIKREAKIGVSTQELDGIAKELIQEVGAKPSFLDFEGYPATLCTSINEEIVHTTPSKRKLKEGDILSLDLGLFWKGYHSDMAITFPIGEVSQEAERLIEITRESLNIGMREAKEGRTIGSIGYAIQHYVESKKLNVVRDLCGHGIGKELHEDPQVLNFGEREKGSKIMEGMVFCIEPMVTIGDWKVERTKDGQGYRTKDASLSCHFEHEVAITREGLLVLTRP